jgi:hypothetical protein
MSGEEEHRVGRQPVLDHVVIAHRVGQGSRRMARHRDPGYCGARVVGRERLGEPAPAPGAARVEPVKVRDVAVARVRNHDRREESPWLAGGNPGKEAGQPDRERGAGQELRHQLGLGQGGREEVEPGGFPAARVVHVAGVPAAGRADQGIEQPRVAGGRAIARVGERERDSVGAVRVDPVANWVRGEGKPAQEVRGQGVPERCEPFRPAPAIRVVPRRQLVDESETPRLRVCYTPATPGLTGRKEPPAMMTRPENHGQAVEYLRRSVERDKSADKDKGAGQRAANAQQAERDSVTIARTFDGDWGTSAGRGHRERRHAMAELIEAIRAGDVSRVYCHTADRLVRDAEYGLTLWNACKDAGTILRPGSQTFDPRAEVPGMLTVWGVLVTQAEEDLDRMTNKTQDTTDFLKAHALTCTLPGRPHRARCHLIGCTDPTHCKYAHKSGRIDYGADPSHPGEDVGAVLAAFDEAGTFLGTTKRLNAAHVPTRLGATNWDVRTVGRIVRRARPEMPHPPSECPNRPKSGPGRAAWTADQCPHAHPARQGARARSTRTLSGLLRCGGTLEDGRTCGQIMSSTPRPGKRSAAWLCRIGHSNAGHSRPYVVSERFLLPAIKAEAAHLRPLDPRTGGPLTEYAETDRTAELDALETERKNILEMARRSMIGMDEAERMVADVKARSDALTHAARAIAIPPAIDWTAPAPALNLALSALFGRIRLGPDLRPLPYPDGFDWTIPEWRAD